MNKQNKATSVHFELHDTQKSSFKKYKELTVGEKGFFFLLKYELITTLFGNFPGALGYFLRSRFYKFLFKRVGKGVIWGKNLTLRHPHKIEVGHHVAVNDYAVLDAYGGKESGIKIADEALISRSVILNSKGGLIDIRERANLGTMTLVYSRDCTVKVGKDVLISAFCYLMGGGSHTMDRTDIPIAYQGAECKGIKVGDHVWLGSGVKVQDGCSVRKDSVVGTNSFVNQDIPEFAVAAGNPAKVIRMRAKKI